MPLPPADPAPGGVSAALWASARPAALACAPTPFMRRLADGCLPPALGGGGPGGNGLFQGQYGQHTRDAKDAAAGTKVSGFCR